MKRKEKSAELVRQFEKVLSCPLCQSALQVVERKSIICENQHTFDFAKQGYVNVLTRPVKTQYDQQLFTARRKTITESHLYSKLHKELSTIVRKHAQDAREPFVVMDAGCGEGSHLSRILEDEQEGLVGIGLDISKEGIKLAAQEYEKFIWLVGDLANMPIAKQSCHVILNILSPANYTEFKRILAPGGLVVKVVPRSGYLMELREELYERRTYENDDTIELFARHFQLLNRHTVSYTKKLSKTELANLVKMSPLAWNATKDQVDRFINRGPSEITVDLDILVGIDTE